MDPARLVRSWQRRLPGAAMVALARAVRGLPQVAAPSVVDAATGGDHTTDGSARSALERGLRARARRAQQALHDFKQTLGDGDVDGARQRLAAVRDLAAPLPETALPAWIAIGESELALASGDLHGAARHSCAAEDLARRASDEATYLAVWWLRAAHALRHGDGGTGELMARWMEPWLGTASPQARLRLRCLAAAFALDDERAGVAIDVAASVVGDAAGAVEHAARCEALAARLDGTIAAPASAADLAAVGIELRLL